MSILKQLKDFQHIIWDWNGTLLDDLQLCIDIINQLLESYQLPSQSVESYQQLFDFPVIRYYERLGFDWNKASFEKISDQFISSYDSKKYTQQLHQNALAVIKRFNANGIKQSILSASKRNTLIEMLNHHDLTQYLEAILGLDDHYAGGKEHLGREWINMEHCDPQRVLYIGDTIHDYEVAQSMGCHCLLLSHGHHSKQRLQQVCEYVVSDFSYLLNSL